jgi:hypothetical protein
MFFNPGVVFDSQSIPTSPRGHEQADLPPIDLPTVDRPAESYASWRPTAIFSLSPFAAPPQG